MLRILICVFAGSGIGGALRYLISLWINGFARNSAPSMALFPWGTFFVNVIGCFIIGLLYGLIDSGLWPMSPETKALLTTGFCGGLTTFSTFSHENYILFMSQNYVLALTYVAISVIIGFSVSLLGHAVVRLCNFV